MVFVRNGTDLECHADLAEELSPAGRGRGEDDAALHVSQVV